MIRTLFLVIVLWLWPLAGLSQEQSDLVGSEVVGQIADDVDELILEKDPDWHRLAERAEAMAQRGDASRFAISRLRAELVVWRDKFLARTGQNSGRIATVDAQIAALGPVPESGEEAPAIADRRAALQKQREELVYPGLLAEEAFARANGLIGEFDAQERQRQTGALTERNGSPLNPANIFAAAGAIWEAVSIIGVETSAGFRAQMEAGRLITNLPWALMFLGSAAGLLIYVRRWITEWRGRMSDRDGRLLPLWLLLLSLGQIIVSIIGLIALAEGLDTLNIFGLRGGAVVEALPAAGIQVVFGWWLCRLVFPVGKHAGYLGYDEDTRAAGRRYGLAIAWVLGVATLIGAALDISDLEQTTISAIGLPILLLLGLLLWRFGSVIQRLPETTDEPDVFVGRTRRLIGRICTVIAIVAPLLSAIGYINAGEKLLVSTILSLALIGFVLVLQRMVHDLSSPDTSEDGAKGVTALVPVLVSFVLYLISAPIFALIWGARLDDILELWARFREGFSIGESRISPTDFLTFAIVFVLGYVLTRFIQGTLRRSVLPRTRLDLGGQNAIVAGFGYVGILLAAIIAITSAGIDLSNLAIVAGALSVGIGFGLQNIVSNFVSGIILLIERPVSEGDWIEVNGQMGYVRAISVRSTRIETFDRTDVIVPNADLVSGQVTNWTRGNLVGRVIVPVGVAYGSDVEKVTQILKDIAEAHPMVLMNPPPAVLFMAFGADSLDFEIRAILRDVNYVISAKSEMNHEIARQFAAAGIEIPFAQRDIWLRNPEVLKEPQS